MGITLRATPASTLAISLDEHVVSDGPLLLVEIDRRPISALGDAVLATSDSRITVTGTLDESSLSATSSHASAVGWSQQLSHSNPQSGSSSMSE